MLRIDSFIRNSNALTHGCAVCAGEKTVMCDKRISKEISDREEREREKDVIDDILNSVLFWSSFCVLVSNGIGSTIWDNESSIC